MMDAVMAEDYNKVVDCMAMEHELAKNADTVQMKQGFAEFRSVILKNFGSELEYSFISAEKKFSSKKIQNIPPNSTIVIIEFSNGTRFGILRVLFDDTSGKILHFKIDDNIYPVPSMTYFWLFGILALCIPVFNIYVIIRIKKSTLKRKWLKYIAVLVFNVPGITYSAMNGIAFKLLSFQMLFGISFSLGGYLNSAWTFGIPLGGLYWLWKSRGKETPIELEEKINTFGTTAEPETQE